MIQSFSSFSFLQKEHHASRQAIADIAACLSFPFHHINSWILLNAESAAHLSAFLTESHHFYQSMTAKLRLVSSISLAVSFSKWSLLWYYTNSDWKNISACVQCLHSGILNNNIHGVCEDGPF